MQIANTEPANNRFSTANFGCEKTPVWGSFLFGDQRQNRALAADTLHIGLSSLYRKMDDLSIPKDLRDADARTNEES